MCPKTTTTLLLFCLTLCLSACDGASKSDTDVVETQVAAKIYSSQTASAPTATGVPDVPPSAVPTPTPAPTPLPTSTPVPPTVAAKIPELNLLIQGCNTSVDVVHGMGEVTNAYVDISNVGTGDAEDLQVTLSAKDESDKRHPAKTQKVAHLPAGKSVLLKLTVDSEYRDETTISIEAVASPNVRETVDRESCKTLDDDLLQRIAKIVGKMR